MTRLETLETEVRSLPTKDYCRFRKWFIETDFEKWDRQIEGDTTTGKLDFLVDEAFTSKKEKKLKDL
jgi:hypothetical protein